ncbi:MAG: GatB/YqeY domain-containing protein [Bacteroidales bacterium]|jgi:uncharacterized protein YqeY|nr:GatB/YqeY domain-containing protein [Bacteroidales bacterium]
MNLFDTISEEIKKAMLAQDKVRLEALRGIKKEFLEARAAKGAHNELSDEAAMAILQKMAKQRRDSADIYLSQNRSDLAETELAQLNIIQEFLPEQMTSEELEVVLKKIIADVGATSMKDMGKVMGIATKQLAGKADGRLISEVVKKLLS